MGTIILPIQQIIGTSVNTIALGIMIRPNIKLFMYKSFHSKKRKITAAVVSNTIFLISLIIYNYYAVAISSDDTSIIVLDFVLSFFELTTFALSSHLVAERYVSSIVNDADRKRIRSLLNKIIIALTILGIVRYVLEEAAYFIPQKI